MLTRADYEAMFRALLEAHSPAERLDLEQFRDCLISTTSATLTGIATTASGEVNPGHALATTLIELSLQCVPVGGTVLSYAATSIADKGATSLRERINILLLNNKHKDEIVDMFCHQAVVYHSAQILNVNPELSDLDAWMQPLLDKMDQAIAAVIPTIHLTPSRKTLLQKLLLQLMNGLTSAVERYEENTLPSDQLGSFLADKIVVIDNTPLTNDLSFSGLFSDLSVEKRYAITMEAIRLSLLAYADKTLIESRAKRWQYQINDLSQQQFFYVIKSDIRCFVLANADTVLCAFRGTVPETISNVFSDINIFRKSTPYFGNVHRGFCNALDGIWEALENNLMSKFEKGNRLKRVIFTGHSLGGALALLAGAKFYSRYSAIRDKLSILTFGQPMVGTDLSAEVAPYTVRFVNEGDPIPLLPSEMISYQHIGEEYVLPNTADIFDWQKKSRTSIKVSEHSLREYQQRLKAHAQSELASDSSSNELLALADSLNDFPALEMPYELAKALEQVVFRPGFKNESYINQLKLLRLFSTALIQGLCQERGKGYLPTIENGYARIKALVQHYSGLQPQAKLSRGELAELFFESERLRVILRLARYQHRARDGVINNIFNDLHAYLPGDTSAPLSFQQQRIIEILQQINTVFENSVSLKEDIALAPLVIITAFATAPRFSGALLDSLRCALHQQPPKDWITQSSLLFLLMRGAQVYHDYWPVLLAEPGKIDLSFWLREEYDVQPFTAKLLLSEIIDLALSRLQGMFADAPVLRVLTRQPNLLQALTEVSQDKTLSATLRLKALQAKHTLHMVTYTDNQALGELAILADEPVLAKQAFVQAYQEIKKKLAAPIVENKTALEAKLTDIIQKIIALILKDIAIKPNLWDKNLGYQEILRYDENNKIARDALFEQGFGGASRRFEEHLREIGTKIDVELTEAECTTRLAKDEVLLQTPFNGAWVLNSNAVVAFDKRKKINNSVHCLAVMGGMHVKENPGCVGLAFAAWSLSRYLFLEIPQSSHDIGLIPVQPAKIIRRGPKQEQRIHYVQLSPTVVGESVQTLLAHHPDPQVLKDLESFYFAAIVILSILLNMEDARDANFVVKDVNGHKHLLSIDNDHVLIRDDTSTSFFASLVVEVKNLVFCLQDMQKLIDADLRKHFCDKNFAPFSRIRAWLYNVLYYNQTVEKFFGDTVMAQLYNRPNDDEKVVLSAFFEPVTLLQPCLKLFKIYGALADSKVRTYHDLFQSVRPGVARVYRNSFVKPTLRARMQEVGGLTGPSQTSNARLQEKIIGQKISDYATFVKNQHGPQHLLLMLYDIQYNTQIIDIIAHEIARGEFTTFIREQHIQEIVLETLNAKYYTSASYTEDVHQAFLQAIGGELTRLTFKGNPLLTDNELMILVNRMPRLNRVILEECSKLTGFAFQLGLLPYDWLTKLCERGIKEIKLKGCANLDPDMLHVLPQLWSQYPNIDIVLDINPPRTWVGTALTHVATVYPEKGLPIPMLQCFNKNVSPTARGSRYYDTINVFSVLRRRGWLVSGSQDGSIKIWNEKFMQQATLREHTGSVNALVVFSNDWLASGSDDTTIRIWDEKFVLQKVLTENRYAVLALTVSPHGWLISGSGDKTSKYAGTINIWNEKFEWQRSLEGFPQGASITWALTVLPSGWLIRGRSVPIIDIWNEKFEWQAKLEGEIGTCVFAVLNNGGLANGLQNGNIEIRDKKFVLQHTLRAHAFAVCALVVSANGWLISGSGDGTIKIWNEKFTLLVIIPHLGRAPVRALVLSFGGQLVSGVENGFLRTWPIFEYILPESLDIKNRQACLLHNARMLLQRGQLRVDQVNLLFPVDLMEFDASHTRLADDLLKALLKRCPRLHHIDSTSCDWLTDKGKNLMMVITFFRNMDVHLRDENPALMFKNERRHHKIMPVLDAIKALGLAAIEEPEILAGLARLLYESYLSTVNATMQTIGQLGPVAAKPEILTVFANLLLQNQDSGVHPIILYTIEKKFGLSAAVPEILNALLFLSDKGHRLHYVISTIGALGIRAAVTPKMLDRFAPALTSQDWWLRHLTAQAIGRLYGVAAAIEISAALKVLLRDKTSWIWRVSREALTHVVPFLNFTRPEAFLFALCSALTEITFNQNFIFEESTQAMLDTFPTLLQNEEHSIKNCAIRMISDFRLKPITEREILTIFSAFSVKCYECVILCAFDEMGKTVSAQESAENIQYLLRVSEVQREVAYIAGRLGPKAATAEIIAVLNRARLTTAVARLISPVYANEASASSSSQAVLLPSRTANQHPHN